MRMRHVFTVLGLGCILLLSALPAQAACAIEAAKDAARDADRAYDAAMEQGPSAAVEVELTEPGQGVTAAPGMAPESGLSDEDRSAMDKVAIDQSAWSPL